VIGVAVGTIDDELALRPRGRHTIRRCPLSAAFFPPSSQTVPRYFKGSFHFILAKCISFLGQGGCGWKGTKVKATRPRQGQTPRVPARVAAVRVCQNGRRADTW